MTLNIVRQAGTRCVVLRVRNSDAAMRARLGAVLSAPLPVTPNRASGNALWLAPDEWLLVEEGASADTLSRLSAELRTTTHHISDVTDGRCVFSVSGPSARDFLARGCSLDLHARAFRPGHCAQSLFAQAPALLHLRSAEPDFYIYADISHAAYLTAWFRRALRFFPSGILS